MKHFLGHDVTNGFEKPCFIPHEVLARHCHLIGKTGVGKSTLLLQLLLSLAEKGHGIGLIDPHGDLCQELASRLPPHRQDDLVSLDFTHPQFAPALNLVSDRIPPEKRPLIASALLSAFKHIWKDSWGPRLEYLLYNALRVLLDAPHTSLLGLPRFLNDSRYRNSLLKSCRDPFVRSVWENEFARWEPRQQQDAISPLQNKIGQFVAQPYLREAFGQVPLRFDFRAIMDNKQILLINLSKGLLGDESSRLAGALLTAFIGSLAMSRADQTLASREPFFLALDECQNFLSEALSSILSESRKYGLSLLLANQYLHQFSPELRSAIIANTGNLFSFNVSADDAEVLCPNYGDFYKPIHFVELLPYHTLIRPHRSHGYPFTLRLKRPPQPSGDSGLKTQYSNQQHYNPRAKVREKQSSWLGNFIQK